MNLYWYYCENCVHSYLDPLPSSQVIADFYTHHYDYYTSPLESQLTTEILSEPIQYIRKEITRQFGKRKIKMVNVGGSDGYSLAQLKDLSSKQLLIEPSRSAAQIAKKHGIPTKEVFLDEKLADALAGQFDVVVNNHVIEHLENPKLFLHCMLKLLTPNGLLFVETPDLLRVLSDTLVRVVSLQHINYFSAHSLQKMMGEDGVLYAVKPIENYAFLACIGRSGKSVELRPNKKRWLKSATTFDQRLRKHCKKLKTQVLQWKGKKIWLWGAGSAAGEIHHVYDLNPKLFAGYIDSDPKKTGRNFVSASALPIMSPEQAYKHGVDAVVITSYSVEEIIKRMRSMGWNVPVTDIYKQ